MGRFADTPPNQRFADPGALALRADYALVGARPRAPQLSTAPALAARPRLPSSGVSFVRARGGERSGAGARGRSRRLGLRGAGGGGAIVGASSANPLWRQGVLPSAQGSLVRELGRVWRTRWPELPQVPRLGPSSGQLIGSCSVSLGRLHIMWRFLRHTGLFGRTLRNIFSRLARFLLAADLKRCRCQTGPGVIKSG